MDRQQYFEKHITGITPEFAKILAYEMKLQEACDEAMFPGAYRRTLRIAADTFPEWFLEDRYIGEITDPETRRIKGRYVVPFRDWVVSITQGALENMSGEYDADHLIETTDRLISRFRRERSEDDRPTI